MHFSSEPFDNTAARMKCINAKTGKVLPCGNRVTVGGVFKTDSIQTVIRPRRIGGPGTELKKLLKKIGLAEQSSCQCKSRAQQMDANGPQWCRDNLDTIVGWLREEAQKRSLPFLETGARLMVKLAIRRAS